jgi:hypothetical protein
LDDVKIRETQFAAAPDTFPPDRFNAGIAHQQNFMSLFRVHSCYSILKII